MKFPVKSPSCEDDSKHSVTKLYSQTSPILPSACHGWTSIFKIHAHGKFIIGIVYDASELSVKLQEMNKPFMRNSHFRHNHLQQTILGQTYVSYFIVILLKLHETHGLEIYDLKYWNI